MQIKILKDFLLLDRGEKREKEQPRYMMIVGPAVEGKIDDEGHYSGDLDIDLIIREAQNNHETFLPNGHCIQTTAESKSVDDSISAIPSGFTDFVYDEELIDLYKKYPEYIKFV